MAVSLTCCTAGPQARRRLLPGWKVQEYAVNTTDLNAAVVDAIREFGASYEGPCELARIQAHQDGRTFTVNLNDTRRSRASGDLFWFDVDTTLHATPSAVTDYVREQIVPYFAARSI